MAAFWTWGVRNPMVILAATFIAVGYLSVADWSLAFTGAAICAFVVEAAGHLAARANERTAEATSQDEELPDHEAVVLKFRIAELEEEMEEEKNAA